MANKKNPFAAPSWLDKEAKKEWKRIVSELEKSKNLQKSDISTLEAYCMAYSRWKQAEKILQKEGYTFETPNGYVQQRPEVAIANKALGEVRNFSTLFGLSPAARSRMNKNNNISSDNGTDPEMEDMISH